MMAILFGLCMGLGCGGMFLMLVTVGVGVVEKEFNDRRAAIFSRKIALWSFIISIVLFTVAYFVWKNLNKL